MAVDHARRQHLQDQIAIPAADSLLAGSSVLISAPTGFGKTNLTLDVFRRVLAARPDVRILAVQDRQAVGEQNIERAKKLGISSTSLSIDGALDLSGQLAGAITRTLYSNLDKIDHRDIVWIDECHHATAD
ncbi:MAG: DEAD/DEAH box helicase family protein, partial [Hyphomicrobiales bacterium]|nr:DEAD/DEAH box helicase family protein [Hyphomicrobiales bacterium]